MANRATTIPKRSGAMQGSLFSQEEPQEASGTSTFVSNMRLPVHKWFRYSAGFSAAWAENIIADRLLRAPVAVFDPFVGSGTTALCAERLGVPAIGVEAHPFVYRVAQAKLSHHVDPYGYRALALETLAEARRLRSTTAAYPPLLEKCYAPNALTELCRLREVVSKVASGHAVGELVWLTLVAILRSVSHVGTAPWQYILPSRTKKAIPPFEAFGLMTETIYRDLLNYDCKGPLETAVLLGDARTCEGVPDDFASLVITSPPYANNYDYADATRLEMTFLGEVQGWGDLHEAVRRHLMRSCSQHVNDREVDLDRVLESPVLAPIREHLRAVCEKLGEIRLTKGGRKNYHLMIACYFHDMAQVWNALRRVCKHGSEVCFVIGDSAPYGIYVPVIEWTGQLALASGFSSWSFAKLRDRNTKWKNRKHRVPLQEGELWVTG